MPCENDRRRLGPLIHQPGRDARPSRLQVRYRRGDGTKQVRGENDAFRAKQQPLSARILRGPHARMRAEAYQPRAGQAVDGWSLAIALRSPHNRFKVGQRIPLDVLLFNASNETRTRDFSFDFIAHPPKVIDEAGNEIPIEKLRLTGLIPLYRETLRPGDTFVYPHIGLGLGENPTPGENWHPHTPTLKPGKYRLTQSWNDLTSGEIEFEVIADRRQAKVDPRSFEIEHPDRRDSAQAAAWTTRRPDAVASESKETAVILDDDSVQMSLPSPNWSAPVVKFPFAEAVSISSLCLELLPDSRFEDRRLGRIPGRELKLFEVKLRVVSADGKIRQFDWSKCSYLHDPDDAEAASLIDHATDTGWNVAPLAADQVAHELVFRLEQPLALQPGDSLHLEIDSGGSDELDTIARFRVLFPTRGEPMKADQSSLEDAAHQSRLAIFANSDKGQVHAEEDQQFEKAAKAFITALSSKDPDGMFPHCSVPWCYQDELIGDAAAVRARLGEISVPGAFALAEKKKYLLLHTLEDLELLLKMKTPVEARKVWAEQLAGTSRIAVVSGGPMLLAIPLRKTEQNHLASGILFAYFPKENDALLKAVNEGRSQRVNHD